jgi:serine protease Do
MKFQRTCGTLLIVMALVIALPSFAQQALTPRQIAARSQLAVVMIKTQWSSNIAVRHWVLPRERGGLLSAVVDQMVAKREIGSDDASVLHAKMELLASKPSAFFLPGGEVIQKGVSIGASGSGSIVTPDGYIVTNAHVVHMDEKELNQHFASSLMNALISKDMQEMQVALNGKLTDEDQKLLGSALVQYYLQNAQFGPVDRKVFVQIGIALPGLTTMAKGVPAQVLPGGGEPTPGKDVALLKIEEKNLPTLPLGDDSQVRKGDRIQVMGFPGAAEIDTQSQGVEVTVTSGEVGKRVKMRDGWDAMQVEAAISGGNSGGPALNEQGQIIGMATFTIRDPETGAQVPGLGYLVPIGVINEFLNQSNIKPQSSELTQLYNSALDDLDAKRCSSARQKFEQVKEMNPGLPFVQDNIREAMSCKESPLTAYMVPLGGLAALIVVGAIALFFLRRPKAAPAGVVTRVEVLPQPGAPAVGALPGGAAQGLLPDRSFGSVHGSSGSVAGKRFNLTKQGLLIGRDPSKCQIVITEEVASKEHAWIVPVDDGVVVIDRGSTNGVYVNTTDGPKVSKVKLHHGDKIFIGKGNVTLTYLSS